MHPGRGCRISPRPCRCRGAFIYCIIPGVRFAHSRLPAPFQGARRYLRKIRCRIYEIWYLATAPTLAVVIPSQKEVGPGGCLVEGAVLYHDFPVDEISLLPVRFESVI